MCWYHTYEGADTSSEALAVLCAAPTAMWQALGASPQADPESAGRRPTDAKDKGFGVKLAESANGHDRAGLLARLAQVPGGKAKAKAHMTRNIRVRG